jgi:hypothetical protein
MAEREEPQREGRDLTVEINDRTGLADRAGTAPEDEPEKEEEHDESE